MRTHLSKSQSSRPCHSRMRRPRLIAECGKKTRGDHFGTGEAPSRAQAGAGAVLCGGAHAGSAIARQRVAYWRNRHRTANTTVLSTRLGDHGAAFAVARKDWTLGTAASSLAVRVRQRRAGTHLRRLSTANRLFDPRSARSPNGAVVAQLEVVRRTLPAGDRPDAARCTRRFQICLISNPRNFYTNRSAIATPTRRTQFRGGWRSARADRGDAADGGREAMAVDDGPGPTGALRHRGSS